MNISLNLEQRDDSELVQMALSNSDDFIYIVKKYEDKLSRYIYRLTNINNDDIEDILQNIFIKTYLNLNNFDHSLKFSSWIYRIAHNEVINNYRRLKARPQTINLDINSDYLNQLKADVDLLKELGVRDDQEFLIKSINKLGVKYREIIILKFLEEKDYKEISDIIKKPLGTVASRINKAKKELKNILNNS